MRSKSSSDAGTAARRVLSMNSPSLRRCAAASASCSLRCCVWGGVGEDEMVASTMCVHVCVLHKQRHTTANHHHTSDNNTQTNQNKTKTKKKTNLLLLLAVSLSGALGPVLCILADASKLVASKHHRLWVGITVGHSQRAQPVLGDNVNYFFLLHASAAVCWLQRKEKRERRQ